MVGRRNFILGLGAALAAPAIIRTPGLLMKLYVPRKPTIQEWVYAARVAALKANMDAILFGFGAVMYPVDGLPQAVDPFDRRIRRGNDVEFYSTTEYPNQPMGLSPLVRA